MPSDKNRLIVSSYDEVARVTPWDFISSGRYVISSWGYAGKLGRQLARDLELEPKDRLLDAGCNAGIYHHVLAPRVQTLVGLDASPHAVERARKRNRALPNAEYGVADLTNIEPARFPRKFTKILCYSVLHFLADIDEAEAVVRALARLLENGRGTIFLGELRDEAMYRSFAEARQRRQGRFSLRDVKFALAKRVNDFFVHGAKTTKGLPPTIFTREQVERMAQRVGAKSCEQLAQEPWHPFYNTCVDYRLRF